MSALKASWTVKGGLIPGQALPEFSKSYIYTSLDAQFDRANGGMPQKKSRYRETSKEARDYAQHLETGGLNWVTVEYLWY